MQKTRTTTMTVDELNALGVSTDIVTAGRAFGLSREVCYDLARKGEFPCTVIRVGKRWIVPTEAIRKALGYTAA